VASPSQTNKQTCRRTESCSLYGYSASAFGWLDSFLGECERVAAGRPEPRPPPKARYPGSSASESDRLVTAEERAPRWSCRPGCCAGAGPGPRAPRARNGAAQHTRLLAAVSAGRASGHSRRWQGSWEVAGAAAVRAGTVVARVPAAEAAGECALPGTQPRTSQGSLPRVPRAGPPARGGRSASRRSPARGGLAAPPPPECTARQRRLPRAPRAPGVLVEGAAVSVRPYGPAVFRRRFSGPRPLKLGSKGANHASWLTWSQYRTHAGGLGTAAAPPNSQRKSVALEPNAQPVGGGSATRQTCLRACTLDPAQPQGTRPPPARRW
jgi:hypothetical protein